MASSELEVLQQFLQERMAEYDPTVDTSSGSSFDAVVVQPLLQRYTPDPYNTSIREFILARLRSEFPSLVISEGEPLDDVVVKPMQALLTPFRRQIEQISKNQSFGSPDTLSEAEADNLAANIFVDRHLGGSAVGVARLYYTAPQYAVANQSNAVRTSNGLRFLPIESQAITADSMLFNVEGSLYYFDVVVRAESEGKEYNIKESSLSAVDGLPQVVKVTNKASFEEGRAKETTAEFMERAKASFTERSLVTTRGINAQVREMFENVRLLQVIGHGDIEMQRDVLKGVSETFQYGSCMVAFTTGTLALTLASGKRVLTSAGSFDSFVAAGVQEGDILTVSDHVQNLVETRTVTSVGVSLTVDEAFTFTASADAVAGFRRPTGRITISDIPGGILVPETPEGTISVPENEVHLGGAIDVFVRSTGFQSKSINLEAIRDGNPLRFGVDLETFGSQTDGHLTQVSALVSAAAVIPAYNRFGEAVSDEILVRRGTTPTISWQLSGDDVGKCIQVLGAAPGTYEILEYIGEEWFTPLTSGGAPSGPAVPVSRIKVSLLNLETNVTEAGLVATSPQALSLSIRIAEKLTDQRIVRDRDASRVVGSLDTGVSFSDVGVSVGDSIVLETGGDAGVYTVRGVLTSLNTDDALILDRELSDTVTPSGIGDGSGVRYRVDDELNIDLVAPKVIKIPLGDALPGLDLVTVAGSNKVSSAGTTNFLLAAVEADDVLEILEGADKGQYTITGVSGTSLTLSKALQSTQSNISFQVYKAFTGVSRPLVRVKDLELLDSNSQPTGIKIPYGAPIDARIWGPLSNRAEGVNVESFTGDILLVTGLFQDSSVDFAAQKVAVGDRLNLMSSKSLGSYTVKAVGTAGGLASNHLLRVVPASEGGTDFVQVASGIHYTVGTPSAGYARLYFLDPTSVEITTGIAGGRLHYTVGDSIKTFRFSDAAGYNVLPASGDEDQDPRDLRVVHSATSPTNHSLVELLNPSVLDVYDIEARVGDVLLVNEPIDLRDSTGAMLSNLGVVSGGGLCTMAGSNRVWVPAQSLVDFLQMNSVYPLVGQLLYIDAGPDAGSYVIEEVVDAKTLKLNRTMTSSTETILGSGIGRAGSFWPDGHLEDSTSGGGFGVQIGHYVTIFEANRSDFPGTYEIYEFLVPGKVVGIDHAIENAANVKTIPSMDKTAATLSGFTLKANDGSFEGYVIPGDWARIMTGTHATERYLVTAVAGDELTLDVGSGFSVENPVSFEVEGVSALDPNQNGQFGWVRTATNNPPMRPFNIYKSVATETVVTAVGSKRPDVQALRTEATITDPYTLVDPGHGTVQEGDLLEVLAGPNKGVYVVESSAGNNITIRTNLVNRFPVSTNDPTPYRVWGGVRGAAKMLTVGPYQGSTGLLAADAKMPYRLVRPGVLRTCSTTMETQSDGALYYVDVQIESDGSGDDLNLADGARLSVVSGVTTDGYQYETENRSLSFSMYEEVSLKVGRRFLPVGNSDLPSNRSEVSGRNLKISYESSSVVQTLNALLRSEADRPASADAIARHFLPAYVHTTLEYSGGLKEASVGAEIETYINQLGANDTLEVSDLEGMITRRGATYVKHPIELVSVTHGLDRRLVVDRSPDKLGGTSEVSFDGTGRISSFIAVLGEGLQMKKL